MAMHNTFDSETCKRQPWNKGKIIGQKPPLKPKKVWAIRTHLQLKSLVRELAMFNLAIDSKLRACDPVQLSIEDVASYGFTRNGVTFRQQKAGKSIQFEMTEATRQAVDHWIQVSRKAPQDYLFSSRKNRAAPLST